MVDKSSVFMVSGSLVNKCALSVFPYSKHKKSPPTEDRSPVPGSCLRMFSLPVSWFSLLCLVGRWAWAGSPCSHLWEEQSGLPPNALLSTLVMFELNLLKKRPVQKQTLWLSFVPLRAEINLPSEECPPCTCRGDGILYHQRQETQGPEAV